MVHSITHYAASFDAGSGRTDIEFMFILQGVLSDVSAALSQSLPHRVDDVKLRLLLRVQVYVTDVLGGWAVDLPRYPVLCILEVPADICDVHIEAELMPAQSYAAVNSLFEACFTNLLQKVPSSAFFGRLHLVRGSVSVTSSSTFSLRLWTSLNCSFSSVCCSCKNVQVKGTCQASCSLMSPFCKRCKCDTYLFSFSSCAMISFFDAVAVCRAATRS